MPEQSYFKNILVAVDGSQFSIQAEELAAAIANKFDSKVTLLHVVPHEVKHPGPYPDKVQRSFRNEVEAMFVQKGQEALGEAKALFSRENVPANTMLEEFADPPETILEVAKEKKSDLVVIGNLGLGKTAGFTLGGVAEKVTRHTECPVLIVKKGAAISKVLVAVDGSDKAAKALEHAVALAQRFKSSITLLNVGQTILPHINVEAARKMGESIVNEAASKVKDFKVEKKVEIGHPSKTIIETAKKGAFDLVVLGNRGTSQTARFLLGSVSDKVGRYAPCSVLLVK